MISPVPGVLADRLANLRTRAFVAGVAGLVLCALGALLDPPVFYRAWLMAWLVWTGVSLGSLALNMLQYLTGGQWGVVVRRVMEASAGTLPLMSLLFIPLLFGIGTLYPWSHPDLVAGDPVLRHKHAYLNVPFFVVRALLYFVVWNGFAFALTRVGQKQENAGARTRARALSAVGLILYVFTVTFAATDWAQSLHPHWYSTIWGFLFVAGQALSAMSLTICAVLVLAQWEPLAGIIRPRHLHDLGKLLFMLVMLWAYLSFSQMLIIWAGNLPEEIPWYIERLATNWAGVSIALLLLQFLLPFLLLLSRTVKRHAAPLFSVAALVFAARFLEMFWIVVPEDRRTGVHIHWLHLVCPAAIGALWMGNWLHALRRRSLLPENDPRLVEVLSHG